MHRVLGELVHDTFRVRLGAADWDDARLPDHVTMNVQVRDERGKLVDQDRDFEALRTRLGERGREAKAAFVGMDSFGASAPADELYEKFGITAEATVAKVKALLG